MTELTAETVLVCTACEREKYTFIINGRYIKPGEYTNHKDTHTLVRCFEQGIGKKEGSGSTSTGGRSQIDDLSDEVNRLHGRLGQMETILRQMQKVIESVVRTPAAQATKGLIE